MTGEATWLHTSFTSVGCEESVDSTVKGKAAPRVDEPAPQNTAAVTIAEYLRRKLIKRVSRRRRKHFT